MGPSGFTGTTVFEGLVRSARVVRGREIVASLQIFGSSTRQIIAAPCLEMTMSRAQDFPRHASTTDLLDRFTAESPGAGDSANAVLIPGFPKSPFPAVKRQAEQRRAE